jgi:outer membrane protein assembly factor BamB
MPQLISNPIDGGDNVKKVILLVAFMATLAATMAATEMTVKWSFNTSGQFADKVFGAGHQGSMTIYDIDGAGMNEVLFGTRRGDSKRLWAINGDGSFQWIYPALGEDGLPGDPTSKVSIVDVDNDGTNELALAGRGGRLHILNGDGSVKWTWDNPTAGDAMHGGPQAMDVDGDGNVEFFLNDNSGFIHRVDNTGNLVWTSFQSGAGNQGQPTIADIDRDDEYEILYASQDFNVYCINALTGAEEWRFDTGANQQTNQVIVADVNNDGEFEAVTWTDAPSSAIFIISFYGTELARWTLPSEGNIRICQAMGDVDNDGIMEMAIMSSVGAFLVQLGDAPMTEWEVNFTAWSEQGLIGEGAQANHWTSYQLIADIDGDGAQEIIWLAPFPIVTDAATGALEAYYWNEMFRLNNRAENGAGWGDADGDGMSEYIAEVTGHTRGGDTLVWALSLGGAFPADSSWPEYYHSALPAADQLAADWLVLKAAGSNSLWFPMPEVLLPSIAALLCIGLLRRRK